MAGQRQHYLLCGGWDNTNDTYKNRSIVMTNVVELKVANKFNEFWDVCPKKIGKPVTKAKWDAITNGGLDTRTLDKDSGSFIRIHLQASADELIEGMKKYRKRQYDPTTYKLKEDGKFTCHPATWLNQGRWMDE